MADRNRSSISSTRQAASALGTPRHPQAVADVLRNRHMWEQRVVLIHDPQPPLLHGQSGEDVACRQAGCCRPRLAITSSSTVLPAPVSPTMANISCGSCLVVNAQQKPRRATMSRISMLPPPVTPSHSPHFPMRLQAQSLACPAHAACARGAVSCVRHHQRRRRNQQHNHGRGHSGFGVAGPDARVDAAGKRLGLHARPRPPAPGVAPNSPMPRPGELNALMIWLRHMGTMMVRNVRGLAPRSRHELRAD